MAYVWTNLSIEPIQLASLFEWLDRIPLSRARTNVEKDFADGLLTAEIIKYYFADLIDLRDYHEWHDVKERQAQWNLLNKKVLSVIGMNIPKHVITQLSICKTGTAPIFLHNLRASLTLFGANTNMIPPVSVQVPLVARPSIQDDSAWVRYNMRNSMKESPKLMHPNEYDFLRQKKQVERVIKSDQIKNLPTRSPNESGQTLTKPPSLPKLPRNPYRLSPSISEVNLTAAKLELDDQKKFIFEKEEEVKLLKEKIKRMETLIANKNSRIQELTFRVEKLEPLKKKY